MSTNSTTTNRAKPPRRDIASDQVPEELRALRRWVGWKWHWNGKKWDKPPVSTATGLNTSKTAPDSWVTFDDAIRAFNNGTIDGIGFCIGKKNDDHPADDPFVVVDLDNCIDTETGLPNDWAAFLLELFSDCYAEVSPSGHGIKIFARGKLGPGKHSDESKGIELLGPGSYVCVTGIACPDSGSGVEDAQDLITYLQENVVQEKSRSFATATMTDREIAINCLDALAGWRRDDYKSWIRVGQILHSIDRSLLSEWDSWSRGSDKYQEGVCAAKWQTFNSAGNGLRIGTLVYWAKEDGWIPPRREQNGNHTHNGSTHRGFDQHEPAAGPSLGVQPGATLPKKIERFSIRQLQEQYPRLHDSVIDGWIRERETANIISVSKIGKSWLLYYLLLCFITKRPIFDRFATAGGKALLIDNELHRPTIASRLKTVAEAMGIGIDEYGDQLEVWPLRGQLRNLYELHSGFDDAAGQFKLVALDAKYRAIPPDTSENDNAAETMFYNEVDRLAEQMQAAFLMIHHSSKGSQSDKRITDVGAGAGAQSRAADCHLILREHEEEDVVVLDGAVRSFKPVEPVVLRWEFPLWTLDDSLDPTLLKGKQSPQDERQGRRDQETDTAILDQCQTWKSRRELRKATGWNPDRINRAIKRLLDAKLLSFEEQEHKGNKCEVFRKTIYAK